MLTESPAGSDVSGTSRSKRGREKQIQSPGRDEEESESSSAKEDDVDSLERGGRSTPQRKTTRRKRNEKSPYGKQDGKDSAEDDDPSSEYIWNDDKRDNVGFRSESRGKLVGDSKRKKGGKGRAVRPKILSENEDGENLERQTSAMEILTDCALKKEAELGGSIQNDDLKIKEEKGMDIDSNSKEDGLRSSKRKIDEKSHKKQVKHETERNLLLVNFTDTEIIERSENENDSMIGVEEAENNVDIKKVKMENIDVNETSLGSESELACMEHVVNILQQAAAIDAEKQRKSKEIISSPSHGRLDIGSGIKTHDKERRKKKRERKRRRRHPSYTIPDVSESENSTQSPFRKSRERNNSTIEFDKEKFDFVSDLSKLSSFLTFLSVFALFAHIYAVCFKSRFHFTTL